jgi:hypothetical protein
VTSYEILPSMVLVSDPVLYFPLAFPPIVLVIQYAIHFDFDESNDLMRKL